MWCQVAFSRPLRRHMSHRCARRCQVRSLGRVEARRARRRTSLVASSERGDDGANQARQELEDELLSDGTGVSMLFPRQVRRFLAGSGAVGCALGIASTAAAAPQSTGNMVENLTINGLGFAACAFWFLPVSTEHHAVVAVGGEAWPVAARGRHLAGVPAWHQLGRPD